MPTAYTSLLGLSLPATGELAGTWGTEVNNGITSLLDAAVAGTTTLSTDADVTLTTTTGGANQARQAILLCSGARTGVRNITAPATSKTYVVINATTGGFGVVIRGAGPTTGVTVVSGERALVAWNGSDFVKVAGNLVTGTATRIPFFDAGGLLSNASDFVRDASGNVGIGTAATTSWRTTVGFDGAAVNGLRVNDTAVGGSPTLLQALKNGVSRFEVLGSGAVNIFGTVTASGFSGSGASLTALNATQLTTGTVPDARFPATLPAASGANLTALNATQLTTGTIPDARFPATLPAANGAALTALNATQLTTGTVPDARFPATLPAASGANLTSLNAGNLGSGIVPDARFPATLPAASGANLTALNATQLTTGTVPDARFPLTLPAVSGANLTALNATQLTTGTIPDARFPATLPAVSGANLTSLNAGNLGSGTIPDARFPAALPAVSGAALTSLNAGNLGSGTIPDARFPAALPAISGANLTALPATLPAASGANLTSLNAAQLTTGVIPDARFPAALPAISGVNLTALPATLPAASGANLTSLNASNLGSGTVPDARFPATLPAVSGANLTALNASNLGSGTVPAARVGTSTVYGMGDGSTIGGLEIGYKNIPRGADQTINTAKRGRVVVLTAGATIPSATFSADDTIALYNNTASSLTITQGSGLTMYGPAAATGNRTLAARGWATIWFNSASECKITGEVT